MNSVLFQTHDNLELIIVDDNSSSETVEYLQRLVKADSRVVLVRNEENLGAGLSRNIVTIGQIQFHCFL